jgi:hypothetical protein
MQGSLLFSEAATDWSFFGTFSLGIGLLIFSKTPSKRKRDRGSGPVPATVYLENNFGVIIFAERLKYICCRRERSASPRNFLGNMH